jgi:hypothetical protein
LAIVQLPSSITSPGLKSSKYRITRPSGLRE